MAQNNNSINNVAQAQAQALTIIDTIVNPDNNPDKVRQLYNIGDCTTVFLDDTAHSLVTLSTTAQGATVKEYKLPQGTAIIDKSLLIDDIAQAIETSNYFLLKDRRNNLVKDSTYTELNSEKKALYDEYSLSLDTLYPNEYSMNAIHPITMTIVYAMTGANNLPLHNIPVAKDLIQAIKSNDRTGANKALNTLIDLRTYNKLKPIKARLSIEEVDNLYKLATAITRKWTAKGIISQGAKDKDILRQCLLAIFEIEYKLTFKKGTGKAQATTYDFENMFTVYATAPQDSAK